MNKLLLCLFFFVLLAGCGRCCNNCYRRPPVMERMEPCVWDYSVICEDDTPEELKNRKQLTREMFDPFAPIDPHHKLAVGDVLDIFVVGEDVVPLEQYVVAPDGKIYYSLARTGVDAAGLTPRELGQELAAKLKHLFTDPIVTVVPKVSKGLSFKILGRVRRPGVYPLAGPVTLKEAIGIGGGFYSRANLGNFNTNDTVSLDEPVEDLRASYIVRNNQKLAIDFVALLESADNSQNIFLRPGDFIYIAPSQEDNVFVLGAVPSAQRVPFYHGITMMGVLADAGALVYPGPYTPHLQKVLILRGALECPCVMQVDVTQILKGEARDIYLKPGDIVYAQDKPYRLARELVYIAVDAFIQSFSATAANYYAIRHWFPPGSGTTTGTIQ